MIQILIFIYALNIFLSPFLVEIKGGKYFLTPCSHLSYIKYYAPFYSHPFFLFDNADVIPCISHFDCPAKFPLKMKCIDEFCRYVLD